MYRSGSGSGIGFPATAKVLGREGLTVATWAFISSAPSAEPRRVVDQLII
jgi:hypothetical protein